MPSDFESGTRKTISLAIQAEKLTSEILKSAMQEFLSGRAEKKGKMSFRQLEKQSESRLDSIEVTENNIADFLQTAKFHQRSNRNQTDYLNGLHIQQPSYPKHYPLQVL